MLLEDTRNKPDKNKDIRCQLETLGVPVERCKLYVGDYSTPTNMSVCVDTKQDILELASNLTNDHRRFQQECERAQNAGIHLVILTADKRVKTLKQLTAWYNPRKKFNPKAPSGKQLYGICKTMSEKYGVTFDFCPREETGSNICKWLGVTVDDP